MNTDTFFNDTLAITKEYESKEDWCNHIHHTVKANRCSYMEAVMEYCDTNDIEIEQIPKLIDDNIKEKIRIEAEQSNLLAPMERLTFE